MSSAHGTQLINSLNITPPLCSSHKGNSEPLSGNTSVSQDLETQDQCDKESLQHGVQVAIMAGKSLSRAETLGIFALAWLAMFVYNLSSGVIKILNPYMTSAFEEHSLTAATSVIASIISAISQLPYSKIIDIWGRGRGILLTVISMAAGSVMMAACQDIVLYCSGQVFYNVGFYCLRLSMSLFIANTISLHNTALMLGFISSPPIISAWLYGPISQRILGHMGLRWGFGIWAIAIPVAFAPFMLFVFILEKRVAKNVEPQRQRCWFDLLFYYGKEFDAIGLVLITIGLGLPLLALSIYSYQPEGWKSPMIICFWVFGGISCILFCLYEIFLAPTKFIPWGLLSNRTVVFTFVMVFLLQFSSLLSTSYFYSALLVLFRQNVLQASYINNIYFMGSGIFAMIIGMIISRYGHTKQLALYIGMPTMILGTGLMINFVSPSYNAGYIVMCQVIYTAGGGIIYPIEQVNLLAIASERDAAALLSIESVIASIGQGFGAAIAATIWTDVFPKELARYLPISALPDLAEIYGSVNVQLSYPPATLERAAIDLAYTHVQRILLIPATCLLGVALVAIALWKDYDVKSPTRSRQ